MSLPGRDEERRSRPVELTPDLIGEASPSECSDSRLSSQFRLPVDSQR